VGFPGIGKDLPGIGKDLPGIGKEGWLAKDGDCLVSKRDVVARLNNGQGPMHCWELAGMSSLAQAALGTGRVRDGLRRCLQITLLCWRPGSPQSASQVLASLLCLVAPSSCSKVARPRFSCPFVARPGFCCPQSTSQLPHSPVSQLAGQADLAHWIVRPAGFSQSEHFESSTTFWPARCKQTANVSCVPPPQLLLHPPWGRKPHLNCPFLECRRRCLPDFGILAGNKYLYSTPLLRAVTSRWRPSGDERGPDASKPSLVVEVPLV